MSSGTGRGLRPGGVVRALGRLSLMIVFGFGAGLLIGVLSEEPELLAGHLRGESVTVELVRNDGGSTTDGLDIATASDEGRPKQETRAGTMLENQLPQVAASAAMRGTEAPTARQRSRAEPVARSDSSRPWAIQVGAFSEEGSAQKLSRALGAKGYPTEILTAGSPAGRWRVRIQPLAGEAKARSMAAELKRVERLPTWVLPMEGSSPR